MLKKIDVLNFITDFRKSPNDIKTHTQLINHLGTANESVVISLLSELKAQKVVREVEKNGEKGYQVIAR